MKSGKWCNGAILLVAIHWHKQTSWPWCSKKMYHHPNQPYRKCVIVIFVTNPVWIIMIIILQTIS